MTKTTGIGLCSFIAIAFALSNLTAAENQSPTKKYANQTIEGLKGLMKEGKKSLERIVSAKGDTEVDRSMSELQDVVAVSTERVRRLSEWDLSKVEKEAEQTFDTTIEAIEDYLAMVAEDGPVHKAANRIRTSALDQARIFREKASAKSSQRYTELATSMDSQAQKVTDIWDAIKAEREIAAEGLKNLKASRELYIDVKKAQGIAAAVKELEGVKNDLSKLSASMSKVQKAVIGESAKLTTDTVKP